MAQKVRVVVAKIGLDGHDRGAKVIARAYRDSGMEVIYLGRHQTVDNVVEAVLQEDVDVLGLSILSGAHTTYVPNIMDRLKENGVDDLVVIVGGIIPEVHLPLLKSVGVDAVFGPGTPLQEIIDQTFNLVQAKDTARSGGQK